MHVLDEAEDGRRGERAAVVEHLRPARCLAVEQIEERDEADGADSLAAFERDLQRPACRVAQARLVELAAERGNRLAHGPEQPHHAQILNAELALAGVLLPRVPRLAQPLNRVPDEEEPGVLLVVAGDTRLRGTQSGDVLQLADVAAAVAVVAGFVLRAEQ